jgi:glycolate oxidase iron-sulfur subunit
MAAALHRPRVFAALLGAARFVGPLLPARLRRRIPVRAPASGAWPAARHARRMAALAGCVQRSLSPDINAAAARLLDRLGISLIEAPSAGCCGALRFHMNFQEDGRADMRALIDAWWPLVESGVEAFVMTASGCGATVKEYGRLLSADPRYAKKAQRIGAMTRDIAEILDTEAHGLALQTRARAERVAFHPPCTLQHGQDLGGVVERLLARAGFELVPVADAHLCCGSAGAYSLLQPDLAEPLRAGKLSALQAAGPARIVTANIGCQSYLAAAARVPVEHWIVTLERSLPSPAPARTTQPGR